MNILPFCIGNGRCTGYDRSKRGGYCNRLRATRDVEPQLVRPSRRKSHRNVVSITDTFQGSGSSMVWTTTLALDNALLMC